ncbi:SRPBCC domain-containing protein [Inquilinus sp. NPDC058860]|uniref:SRPBCC family protein n=1 Tax=Inquilinus sp. NPDC058860 TaxID=3346652 RepID=UPI0036CC17DE
MPVKKDETGRRFVEAEVEVPGTPEEVWQAIATGPGITSWFVPTRVEERVGGAVTANFGPGMESLATITAWDPPRRFAADSNDMGPGSPTIATEWTVEAKAGGTCIVRVVHAWFAETDDWDAQFEGHEHGWRAFFRILRLYLAHFRGQHGVNVQLMGVGSEPTAREAWVALTEQLGIAGAGPGQRVQSAAGAPALAGQVERVGPDDHPELLLRLDAPAPGIAHLFALPMGGQIFLPIRLYLFGDRPAAVAAREEPAWQAWMARHFPMPAS